MIIQGKHLRSAIILHSIQDGVASNVWDNVQCNFQTDARHNVTVSIRDDIWHKVWSNGMSNVRNDVAHHVLSHFPTNNK